MIFMDAVTNVLIFIVAFNIWLTLGGLIIYFIDAEHVHDNNVIALLGMYFMFPIVIVLSLIEDKRDASKSNTK